MPAPPQVMELCERFDYNRDSYRSGKYNETQLRREFLDPLFKALGWDIDNEQGFAEAYKDVIHEDAIKISGTTKAPDYCFRIGGARKFFLEAKKPSVNVKDEVKPAFQLRRYAWSAKLPLSILSDFEEFAVYDCRVQPQESDKPATARIMYMTYKEYAEKWDDIAAIFSKNAILRGAFDKYAETKNRRGTAEVDAAFLNEIERWRECLAQNVVLHNPGMSSRDLNFAVQVIIDRIIFLRICEDRGIEDLERLQSLLQKQGLYPHLVTQFRDADERYNSGLFHLRNEKGRSNEGLDTITPGLRIDDVVFKDIIKSLYYPAPYAFKVFPADILGQVYERFLAKVIRKDGQSVVIEEKPEVKKAGGVYYTPTYVVNYIVEETVGNLLDGKTLRQAEKLKILDPACGSGSFLIAAYQRLLDWHLDWYLSDGPEKHTKGNNPRVYQGVGGGWRLTTGERKRILLTNIYGVDIDPQAVEVTKLSLLLKVLEGETQETVKSQLMFSLGRVLPDLDGNIKCGNSLVAPNFYDGKQMSFDEEEAFRVNVFDWAKAFPSILSGINPGFDAIIGNPPYIPIELMPEGDRAYFRARFPQIERKYDTSVLFMLAMLGRLNAVGRLGFISSITWQTGENYNRLREHLFTRAGVETLVNLPFDVFNAYVDTGIYILTSKPTRRYSIYRFPKKVKISALENIPYSTVPCSSISAPEYKVVLETTSWDILSRLLTKTDFVPLGSFTISTQGLAANRFHKVEGGEEAYPFMSEGQAYRYILDIQKIDLVDMSEHRSLKPFYEAKQKVLVRRVVNRQDRLMAAYCDERMVFKKDVNPFVINDEAWNAKYVLGILNSKLISHLYMNTSSIATKDDFRQTTLGELRRLPIPRLSPGHTDHDNIVKLVETVEATLRQLKTASPHTKTMLQGQLDTAEHQVDRIVYKLYGLLKEEIDIVDA